MIRSKVRQLATMSALMLASSAPLARAQLLCPHPDPVEVDTGGTYCLLPPGFVLWAWPEGYCGCQPGRLFEVICYGGATSGATQNGTCSVECHDAVGELACPGPNGNRNIELPCNDCDQLQKGGAPAAPTTRGKPVSVTTGAVFFTHTDATVGELSLSRTYNSGRLDSTRYGRFGPGWNSSADTRLRIIDPWTIEARSANGFAQYYLDSDLDGTFEAALPVSYDSHLETLSGGGGYLRVMRTGEVETYSASGALLSFVDASGVATTYQYDGQGRLTTMTRRGRSLGLFYSDGTARPAQLLGPENVVLATYTYTSGGALETVRYPDGGGYKYGYDSAGKMAWVSDLDGHLIERHEYWGSQALTSETSDGRDKLTFTYNAGSTVVTDATGVATTYEYATFAHVARVTKVTGPCSDCGGSGGVGTRVWTYDGSGNVVRYQNEIGDQWNYTFGPEKELLTETDPYEQTTTYTYYADGRIHTRSGPDGSLTTYTYGPAGPLTLGEKVSASETRTTAMTYTASGQLESVTDPRSKTTSMSYTSMGDLETVTDPLSHVTHFGYDSFGRRSTIQDPLGHTTTTAYDSQGRVTRVTQHDGTHSDFAYDRRGRRTSVTDAAGRVTRYVYDPYGRLERTIDPMGGATVYVYDLMGRLTSLTDANGHTTRFVYDQDRLVQTIYPGTDSPTETYTYDAGGRIRTKTDRRGVLTTFDYDALGRLKSKTYSDGTPTATYTYDEDGAIGRLTTAANGTDTLHWTYDLLGQLKSESSTRNSSSVSYVYDAAGNRVSVSLDGQVFVTYQYDDASRLTNITRGSSVFGFEYDDANRRTRMTYPNGVTTTYAYDSLNRLTGLQAQRPGPDPTVTSFGYTYDAAGNRVTKVLPEFTETYAYDPLYRLTGVDRTGTQTGLWRYAYDGVGNRTSAQTGAAAIESTYDERNQLRSSTAGGQMLWRGTLDEPGNVIFTSALVNGQPARMLPGNVFEAALDMHSGTNAVELRATDVNGNVTTKNYEVDVAGNGATYTYDPNGNLTSKTEGTDNWAYTWNAENQLVKVEKNGAEAARFAYDAGGRRVEKVAGGVTTTYVFDEREILREQQGASVTKYTHGPGGDEPIEGEADGSALYYSADGIGSLAAASTSAGVVAFTRQYDAWGTLQDGASRDGYAFTGREWDPEISLYYYRARYYEPNIGRFISEDPIGLRGDLNLYRYALANPIRFRDPLGLDVNICLYPEGAHGAGHAGFGVGGESGTEGFYPKWPGMPAAPGIVKPDSEYKQKECRVLPSTPDQDTCMLKCRQRRKEHPGFYDVNARNCATYVQDCLAECKLPPGWRTSVPTWWYHSYDKTK
jgi:RHS repeat-associated protein